MACHGLVRPIDAPGVELSGDEALIQTCQTSPVRLRMRIQVDGARRGGVVAVREELQADTGGVAAENAKLTPSRTARVPSGSGTSRVDFGGLADFRQVFREGALVRSFRCRSWGPRVHHLIWARDGSHLRPRDYRCAHGDMVPAICDPRLSRARPRKGSSRILRPRSLLCYSSAIVFSAADAALHIVPDKIGGPSVCGVMLLCGRRTAAGMRDARCNTATSITAQPHLGTRTNPAHYPAERTVFATSIATALRALRRLAAFERCPRRRFAALA